FQSLSPNKLNILSTITSIKNRIIYPIHSILLLLFQWQVLLNLSSRTINPQLLIRESTLYCSLLFHFAKANGAMHFFPRDGRGENDKK
ncbi:hypothetical protein ACHAXS_002831, partial [Conticribra weissflogii]